MADKNINFNIKVNNKELDLTKVSFKQFNEIIKQAKKDLQALPLTDPRYKQLVTDINAAEKAWKEAKKSSGEFNDEQEKGAESVKSYRAQIREATEDLVKLENQYGKNSEEADNQRQKIGELRDAQEELNRTTQDLDDTLAALPGPIGQVGQGLQQLESLGQNAGSALSKLGLGFSSFDKIVKTSLVGFLVGLLVTLVAAVMDAAKSFKPLQDAMAGFSDAIGAVFNALKPLTDFILNVVVGAIEALAGAINFVAEAFGGVSSGFKTTSLALEREIKKQEAILNNYGTFLSEYYTKQLGLLKKYNEDRKAIMDDETKNVNEKNLELFAIDKKFQSEKSILEKQRAKITRDNENNVNNIKREAAVNGIDNQRKSEMSSLESQKQFQEDQANSEIKAANGRIIRTNVLIKELKAKDATYFKETIDALEKSVEDEKNLVRDLGNEKTATELKTNSEISKIRRQQVREDINVINERSLKIQELATQLIKEENARNVQAAKDNIARIKEQNRIELQEAKLAGISLKNLKEKQAAELKLAQEQIRKSQLELSAFEIQQEIDKQNRLATEAGIGTQEYFDARREIAEKEFQKEVLLADGNINLIENARTKLWASIIEIDKEGFAQMATQVQTEYNGMYEGTVEFFDKQRQLESANYIVEQANARGNYDMLEALAKQHAKNLAMIDVAQLQAKADIESRKAATVNQITDEYYTYSRQQENLQYAAQIKAAGDNLALIETINMEHAQRMRDLDAQQYEAKKQVYLAIVDLTAQFGQTLNQIGTLMMDQAQGRDKKQFENAKKMAIAGIAIEKAAAILSIIANTGIANAKAVAAFPITFGQPWVTINTVSAGLSIAAIIAGAVSSISQLNSQNFEPSGGSGSSSGSGGNGMGRGYADGGLVKGPGTSKSDSIPARLSNGEAVMTSGAVTMFGPMLSMMNQMGGGTSFAPNALTVRPDNPKTNNPAQEQSLIVKTYVVENEMTSIQQRQARLKDLSTL